MSREERENNDKEFFRMLGKVVEIRLELLKNWYGSDDFRKEMVAKALENGDIDYEMTNGCQRDSANKNKLWITGPNSDYDYTCPGPRFNSYLRMEFIKEYMSSGLKPPCYFLVNAASLKEWLNKTFPLEPDSVSVSEPEGFMSKELKIAVECNRSLYSKNPSTQAREEGGDIRTWLENNHPELSETAITRISQVVNPGFKHSGKKK